MIKTRLERLQKYLADAERDPINNQLYIEDLKISIEHAKLNPNISYQVLSGFSVDNQIENV